MSRRLLFVLLMSTFAPASAQVTARIAVRTADLDLSQPADVARLQRRIAAAVERGCTPEEWSDAAQPSLAKACREEANTKAAQQVAALIARDRLATAVAQR